MQISVFPKFQKSLSCDELAQWVREVGLGAVNIVIREGYWCEDATLARDVPAFLATMQQHNVAVPLATAAGLNARQIIARPDQLRILADHGLPAFRMGYFDLADNPHLALEDAKRSLDSVAKLCQRIGIKAIYQLHHRKLISSPSAAYMVMRDLPPDAVGVMLDPGNQSHEGWENLAYAIPLLGPHLAAVGVKDSTLVEGKRQWRPIHEGDLDWPAIAKALQAAHFDGPLVLMPFYSGDDPAAQTAAFKQDVATIQQLFA